MTTSAMTGAPRPVRALDLSRRRRPGETVVTGLLAVCGLLSIGTTAALIFTLVSEGSRFFSDVSVIDFVTGTTWAPKGSPQLFGVLPLVAGTLLVTAIAVLVAVPLGVGAATYLSEYARPRTRRILKPLLELLAGVPTVVYGYFALVTVTPIIQKLVPGTDIFNAASAGLVMGVMIIPTVASLSEDAMRAVPHSLREGAFGLGATRKRVAVRIVIPAALSGIAASILLGISRAIGETMIVAIAAGNSPKLTADPFSSIQTMTGYIANVSLGDSQQGTVDYQSIFAVAFALFLMTLALNLVSVRLVRRFRQVYQ